MTDAAIHVSALRREYGDLVTAGLARTAESAPLVALSMVLPLSFLSGVWGPPPDGALLTIAELFPVRMLVAALQHAYDPGVTGAAVSPQKLATLALWGLGGLWLSARFLRQEKANG